uniref:Uncharacterized protein n=1 Tax=Micrurus surinamensis TaxID=129470 RepID=A0A2D4PPZ9_MICSU
MSCGGPVFFRISCSTLKSDAFYLRKHSQIWNQNLITCYSEGNQACSAQHPPSADMMHHRSGHNVRPSNRIFFSQEQFQGYQRPSFQELNPHGSLQQHRNQIDKQHYWTP